ncbi:hypothetical protein RND61_08410 [Streptomyces sp. TRM76323]|uniref:Uncharacterized protein n=1 Tax=Streptomyces tamarix TaxID=3078565 RepID=A0ABU3QH59_9ACTN|nr:hypothetical protein [Streptomyces tamarix]MDT9682095.1 hypothetical protein [Streptomyces tamarix]
MPFEDELGEALRRVGGTFDTDRQEILVMTATEQGRRSVRRRRSLAVAASVVALGLLGTGAYASGILPDLDRDTSIADETPVLGGDRVFSIFEKLLPDGTLSQKKVLPRGPGEYVRVSFLYRPDTGGDRLVEFRMGVADASRGDDGGRNLTHLNPTKPTTATETGSCRRQVITPEGHFIDLVLWNSPDPKSPEGTRPAAGLSWEATRLTNANEWRKELARFPKVDPLLGEKPMDPAWVRPPATVSGPGMAATLQSLLPKGTYSARAGRGTDHPLGPAGSLLYDDGKGAARVEVTVYRVDRNGASVREHTRCRSRACERKTLPDGSLMRAHELRHNKGTKQRVVTYVSASGDMVEVTAWNTPDEKSEVVLSEPPLTMELLKAGRDEPPLTPEQLKAGRDEPPLTMEQLKAVAMSSAWRPALSALPVAPDEEVSGPTRPSHWFRNMDLIATGEKTVWNEDGLGDGLVELRVDRNRRHTGDEPLLEVRQERVDRGGKGVIRWVLTGAQPGGARITVTAYNAPAPDADATRTTPPISLPWLKTVVLSDNWNNKNFQRSLELRKERN